MADEDVESTAFVASSHVGGGGDGDRWPQSRHRSKIGIGVTLAVLLLISWSSAALRSPGAAPPFAHSTETNTGKTAGLSPMVKYNVNSPPKFFSVSGLCDIPGYSGINGLFFFVSYMDGFATYVKTAPRGGSYILIHFTNKPFLGETVSGWNLIHHWVRKHHKSQTTSLATTYSLSDMIDWKYPKKHVQKKDKNPRYDDPAPPPHALWDVYCGTPDNRSQTKLNIDIKDLLPTNTAYLPGWQFQECIGASDEEARHSLEAIVTNIGDTLGVSGAGTPEANGVYQNKRVDFKKMHYATWVHTQNPKQVMYWYHAYDGAPDGWYIAGDGGNTCQYFVAAPAGDAPVSNWILYPGHYEHNGKSPVPQIRYLTGGLALEINKVKIEVGIKSKKGKDITDEHVGERGQWNVGASGHVDYSPPDAQKQVEAMKHAIEDARKKTVKKTLTRREHQNCIWQWILPFESDNELNHVSTEQIARTESKSVPPLCVPGCAADEGKETGSTYQECVPGCT